MPYPFPGIAVCLPRCANLPRYRNRQENPFLPSFPKSTEHSTVQRQMPARSLNIPAASEEADILSPLSSVLFDPGIGSGRRCRLIRYKMARHVWVIASGVGGGRRLFVFGRRRNSLLALLYRLPGFLLRRPVKAKLPVDKPPHNVGPVPKTFVTHPAHGNPQCLFGDRCQSSIT